MALTAEAARLVALRSYGVLDSEPEAAFDDLTRLAAQLCGTPMALVSLVDEDRQWFKSHLGLEICSTTRDVSFCAHALGRPEILVVPDARLDPRFAANPQVTGDPWIRFYAGAPLVDAAGHTLGTLCVLDVEPRTLSPLQLDQLGALARQVVGQLSLRRRSAELAAEITARQASQSALAESRQMLESVLQHTSSAIYAKDLDGRYLLGNHAFQSVVGDGGESILGRSDYDLFPQLVADQFHRNDLAIARSGRHESFTEQLPTRDGRVLDYLSTKFPLRTPDGVIYAVAGVSTDVTELAEQRRRHAESEARWRSLVEHSPVAVVIISDTGVITYANPRGVDLYGVADLASLVGREAGDFVPAGREDDTRDLFVSALRGELITGRRWTLKRHNGQLIDVVINAASVSYGDASAVQVELRDVTAQAQAEQALRESERSWQTLFGASPVGIGLSDEHGLFVEANEALCILLGRPKDQVIGHSSAEFTHAGDLTTHRQASDLIEAAVDGVVRIEKRYVRPDGTVRWAWLTVTHTPGPIGQTWTLAHVQDITERKATERAVVDSEANLRAVAGVVQHIQAGSDARQTIVEAGLDLAQAAYVSLIEQVPGEAVLRVSATTRAELQDVRTPLDAGSISAEVFRTGRPLFLPDPALHPLVDSAPLAVTGARSFFAVPVHSGAAVTAVLVVAWSEPIATLDDRRAGVVTLLADQAGVALRQAALLSELESLALTDPLTGLPNRRSWDQQLAQLLALASRNHSPLTIAMADLDHFKTFNDTRGHPAGDVLLKQFALGARDGLRTGDTIARWGGEEFAISLPNCGVDDASQVLDRVRSLVPGDQSCSIGYATWDRTETAQSLLARVDQALYAAKTGGRNRVCAAD